MGNLQASPVHSIPLPQGKPPPISLLSMRILNACYPKATSSHPPSEGQRGMFQQVRLRGDSNHQPIITFHTSVAS